MPSLISRVVDSLRATRSSWLLTCASPNRDLTTRLQDRQYSVVVTAARGLAGSNPLGRPGANQLADSYR
jgi:hypothetical protein